RGPGISTGPISTWMWQLNPSSIPSGSLSSAGCGPTTRCGGRRAQDRRRGWPSPRAPAAVERERWADEGSAAMLPEPRTAFHMSDRQDRDFIIFQAVDDVVGEARDQYAAAFGVFVRDRSDRRLSLDALDRRVDGVVQFSAQ